MENIVLGIVLKRRVNNMSFVYDWKVKNGDDVKVEYCWSSVDNCVKIVEMRVNGNGFEILSQDFYTEEEVV